MATIGGIVVPTGGTIGVRRQFNEVIDELARPVNADDQTVRSYAADAFRAAVRWMDRKGNWPWEIMDEDITISANNAFVTVTGAIKKPLALHYLESSGGTRDERLCYVPYDVFMESYDLNLTGHPTAYTIPNLFETGQLRLFPVPGTADNARFTYYRSTPVPRNESEALEIPEYITEVYMSRAWYEFVKRLPSEQRPVALSVAFADSKQTFRELVAHVIDPGDRTRQTYRGVY